MAKVHIYKDEWYCYGIQSKDELDLIGITPYYTLVEIPDELEKEYFHIVNQFTAWQLKIKAFDESIRTNKAATAT